MLSSVTGSQPIWLGSFHANGGWGEGATAAGVGMSRPSLKP